MDTSLQSLSPATYQMLLRTLGPSFLPELAAAFAEAVTLSGLDYPNLNREPGVNFNPLPARLPQILIRDGNETNSDLLTASLYLPAAQSQKLRPSPKNSAPISLALQTFSTPTHLLTQPLARLLLAATLDELRHLHLLNITPLEKQNRLTTLKSSLSSIPLHQENSKLHTLTTAAINRLNPTH